MIYTSDQIVLWWYGIKDDMIGGACDTYEGKKIIQCFVEIRRERRLGRPGCRWDYNKFLNFTELEWEGIDCVCLDQDRQYGDMMRIWYGTFGFNKTREILDKFKDCSLLR